MGLQDQMRILVLDDDDERHERFRQHLKGHSIEHVFTVDGVITQLIAEPVYDVVFLDHDLNDHHYKSVQSAGYGYIKLNGVDVASFIAKILEPAKRPKAVVVHSWNPEGAKLMVDVLEEAGIKNKLWEWHPKQHPLKVNGLEM